ncbi:pyruvate formate lyase family protein [Fangia hongkongensis]|uniref:pyruvate formate lyase family protein n=1 Tax=Fangia hongkongensis TaxID=270495 RepID=UPI00037122D9|nr:pyruvate formate lyase family protein [Fangia hongkongensis]MBK2125212.1 formate acetyltransferase [Fangia hongkongensis]
MNTNTTLSTNDRIFETLQTIADSFNNDADLCDALKGDQGWINATIVLTSEDHHIAQTIEIKNGVISITPAIISEADATLVFLSEKDFIRYTQAKKDDVYRMILKGRMRVEGNAALYYYYDYLTSLITLDDQKKATAIQIAEHKAQNLQMARESQMPDRSIHHSRVQHRLKAKEVDSGVKYLGEPYLSKYTLDDFPRLMRFRQEYLNTKTQVTIEHGKLLTDFFIKHGYEYQVDGNVWDPVLRKAQSFNYLMENKRPVIREDSFLAGTYTPNAISGTITQPYAVGWQIWGELNTLQFRELDAYHIKDEDAKTWHKYVMPFWASRNLEQLWKTEFNHSLASQIHSRYFALYFWKTFSHSALSVGFEKVVTKGLNGLKDEISQSLEQTKHDQEGFNTLTGMRIAIDGVLTYCDNLKSEASKLANKTSNPLRAKELQTIADRLSHVPQRPARTLDEALQSLWIMHIAVGLESHDDGPSMARLDQILQPYFISDIQKLKTALERQNYIEYVIEILGDFFFRLASHQIATPEIASWQNSGAPPTTSIVVGGVDDKGKDAVNDMSYIILKVTEMLRLNDPNMHARFMPEVNSLAFLKRVCEVNYITCATPCIHNDNMMLRALSTNHPTWDIKDIRNWTPTGCVEPTIPGMHCSTTGSIVSNLMAPFEMTLNNGTHPLQNWKLGPETGELETFTNFEDFYNAFVKQFEFLYTIAIEGNNELGVVNQRHMPSPLLSSLLDSCIQKGRGLMRGGAKYNTSGVSLIGLSDLVDSLLSIKQLVFDEKRVSLSELKHAIDQNYVGYEKLRAIIQNTVPKFGSGNKQATDMAKKVTLMIANFLHSHQNFRGGRYTPGYWTMNNHTVYGRVSGASPSGRLAGEPFTPGLTPNPKASKNILDNLLDVAKLAPETLDNNIAFNVRIAPSKKDSHEEIIDRLTAYVKTYFEQGGMQVQLIMIDTDTLKDAMAHPELYPDLMVRVSGYCGYFTKMQRDLQLEIIRRSEYGV